MLTLHYENCYIDDFCSAMAPLTINAVSTPYWNISVLYVFVILFFVSDLPTPVSLNIKNVNVDCEIYY